MQAAVHCEEDGWMCARYLFIAMMVSKRDNSIYAISIDAQRLIQRLGSRSNEYKVGSFQLDQNSYIVSCIILHAHHIFIMNYNAGTCSTKQVNLYMSQFLKFDQMPCKHIFLVSFYHAIPLQHLQHSFPRSPPSINAPQTAPTPPSQTSSPPWPSSSQPPSSSSPIPPTHQHVSTALTRFQRLVQRKVANDNSTQELYEQLHEWIEYYDDNSYISGNARLQRQWMIE